MSGGECAIGIAPLQHYGDAWAKSDEEDQPAAVAAPGAAASVGTGGEQPKDGAKDASTAGGEIVPDIWGGFDWSSQRADPHWTEDPSLTSAAQKASGPRTRVVALFGHGSIACVRR